MSVAFYVRHVLRKDLLRARWMLVGFIGLCVLSASSVIGVTPTSPSVVATLAVMLGLLLLVLAVQDDAAIDNRAAWRARPVTPNSVASAKLLLLFTLLAIGVTLQCIAALAFDITASQFVSLILRSQWLLLLGVAAVVIAAATPDLRHFLLAALFAPLAAIILVWFVGWELATSPPRQWMFDVLRSSALFWIPLLVCTLLVVGLYARRVSVLTFFAVSTPVAMIIALRALASLAPGDALEEMSRSVSPPRDTVRFTVSARVAFAEPDASPYLLARVTFDSGARAASTERIIAESGTAVVRFTDQHERTVHLHIGREANVMLREDGSESATSDEPMLALQQPAKLVMPNVEWPDRRQLEFRLGLDSLTADERRDLAANQATVTLQGTALALKPRPALIVPLTAGEWSARAGIRVYAHDSTVVGRRAAELVLQNLPGAAPVANRVLWNERDRSPDLVLFDLDEQRVVQADMNQSSGAGFPLVLPSVSVDARRLTLSPPSNAIPDSMRSHEAVTLASHRLGLAVIGWDVHRRMAFQSAKAAVSLSATPLRNIRSGSSIMREAVPARP